MVTTEMMLMAPLAVGHVCLGVFALNVLNGLGYKSRVLDPGDKINVLAQVCGAACAGAAGDSGLFASIGPVRAFGGGAGTGSPIRGPPDGYPG